MEKENMGKEEEKENMKKEDTIKLISEEGTEFILHREAAMVSQTIRKFLTRGGDFKESRDGKMRFPKIRATILEKVIEFFYWSLEYRSGKQTEFYVEPELLMNLYLAALSASLTASCSRQWYPSSTK